MACGLCRWCRLLTALPIAKLLLCPPKSQAGPGYEKTHGIMDHGKHITHLFNTNVRWRWEETFKDWRPFVPSFFIRKEEMFLIPSWFSSGSRHAFCTEPDWVSTKPKSLRPSYNQLGTPRKLLVSSSVWQGSSEGSACAMWALALTYPQPAACCVLQLAKSQPGLFFFPP